MLRFVSLTVLRSFLRGFKAGGVDAVVNDKPVNDYYITKAGGKDAKEVGTPLTAEEYGIATAKKNTEMTAKLDKALEEIKGRMVSTKKSL